MDPCGVESQNAIIDLTEWRSNQIDEWTNFTFLQNVVDDRSGEVPGGGEDGRAVEYAHLVARNLVILEKRSMSLEDRDKNWKPSITISLYSIQCCQVSISIA